MSASENTATGAISKSELPAPSQSLRALLGDDNGTVTACFSRRSEITPDKNFLTWEGRTWSYAEAKAEVQRFGGMVRSVLKGFPELRVASYLPNCPEALWSWIGTLWAGRVFVPLNREHQGAILMDMLRRSRAGALVTDQTALEILGELDGFDSLGIKHIVVVGLADASPEFHGARLSPYGNLKRINSGADMAALPLDIACVMYSSGTTGRSKAVMIPHNQLVRGAGRIVDAYGIRASDVVHNWLPLYHLAGQLHMTMTAVIAGASMALFPRFSNSRFRNQVDQANATVICGVTSIIELLLTLPESAWDRNNTLRTGIIGGIPKESHRKFERRFGLRIEENYGMTEADPITHPYANEEVPLGSCGRAGLDYDVNIFDEHGNLCAVGDIGEIVARPKSEGVMMLGYEGDAEQTSKAYFDEWFRTGDLGYLDNKGYLYFHGRKSGFVRRRGENISCNELEQIALTCPGVNECACLGVPSEYGEEEVKLVLSVSDPNSFDVNSFWDWCEKKMAKFMVPRFIEVTNELPKSSLGKVLVGELKSNTGKTRDRGQT